MPATKKTQRSGNFRIRLPRDLHTQLAAEAERQRVSLNTLMVTLLARGLERSKRP